MNIFCLFVSLDGYPKAGRANLLVDLAPPFFLARLPSRPIRFCTHTLSLSFPLIIPRISPQISPITATTPPVPNPSSAHPTAPSLLISSKKPTPFRIAPTPRESLFPVHGPGSIRIRILVSSDAPGTDVRLPAILSVVGSSLWGLDDSSWI